MRDLRVQFALDNFIADGYFLDTNSSYLLEETDGDGRSELSVCVSSDDSLCAANFDKKARCGFVRIGRNLNA